jgi:hypothetical protein
VPFGLEKNSNWRLLPLKTVVELLPEDLGVLAQHVTFAGEGAVDRC